MDALHDATIICPDCGAELRPVDETCAQCGGRAANRAATASKAKLKQLLDRPWVIVVLILHVGLLGIPIYWKTNYSRGTRLMMVVVSIVYTVAAVTFIVVMLRWLYRMLLGG